MMKAWHGILGACFLAVVVFFIPGFTGTMWTSLLGSMIVVGFFFIGILVYILRYSQTTGDRILGIGLLVVLIGLSVRAGWSSYQQAQWQHRILTQDIRSTIDEGIITAHLNKPFLRTLEDYYLTPGEQKKTLQEIFQNRYNDNIEPIGQYLRYIPEDQSKDQREDPPFLYYDTTGSENHLRLVGQSRFGNGRDSSFVNYDGTTGNLQFNVELTPKGLSYDRKN